MSDKRGLSSDVGYLAAAFMAPRTFQKSMMERDAIDQGVVTGLTMVLSYTVAAVMQDGVEAITNQVTKDTNKDPAVVSVAGNILAVGAGLIMQTVAQQKEDESTKRGLMRTAGYWLTISGAAGAILQGLDSVISDSEDSHQISGYFVLPIGVLIAMLFDYAKYKKLISFKDTYLINSPAKVVGVGAGVIGILSALSITERFMAKRVQTAVDTYAKPLSKGWLPVGHMASLAVIGGGVMYGLSRLYGKVESSQDKIEEGFSEVPKVSYVSGEMNSRVKWETLSVQGRRHVMTRIPASKINKDLGIKSAKEPIRLYVGLDSALGTDERVQLALDELDRTKAWNRKYLMLIAPTGSGYVNYVMSDAFEYLSKGDCAQITMQYSKRPSPLSLDKVDDGFIQFRILVNRVAKKIKELPQNKRPKVLLFGESLGAWVSQDAFLHSGTDGLLASGIDYALWIGTPELSKWRNNIEVGKRLNIDGTLVGSFDNIKDFNKIPEHNRSQMRYVMVTHHNDPVAHFSAGLLIRSPKWLKRGNIRPSTLPDSAHYRTPTTFVQTAVDMKNALKPKPGEFTSHGHDYRADILGFMNEVNEFNVTKDHLKLVNKLLIKNDKIRGNL